MAKKKPWYKRELSFRTLCRLTGPNNREAWSDLFKMLNNESDLIFLGRQPLREIRKSWRKELASMEEHILRIRCKSVDIERELSELDEKSADWRYNRRYLHDYGISLAENDAEIAAVKQVIERLDDLIVKAEEKPVIPQLRNVEWFSSIQIESPRINRIKCAVCVPRDYFYPDVDPEEEGKVYFATVDRDHSRPEGMIIRFERPTTFALKGTWTHQWYDDPMIMGKWEYEYLKTHEDFRALWLKCFKTLKINTHGRLSADIPYYYAYKTWEEILNS